MSKSNGNGRLKFFSLETDADGITVVTFNRPPVNAMSFEVYPELKVLADIIESSDESRVVIITSPPEARAWCGGADLNDFLPLDFQARLDRYRLVEDCLPRLYNLNRPVIAALNMHAVGVGFVMSTFCDIRVASNEAFFAVPEIDRGVMAAGGAFFTRLNMPMGKVRELVFTGRRFTAEELRDTGVFNYIVPKAEVMPKSLEIARIIAKKSLPALKFNKTTMNLAETMPWQSAYSITVPISAHMTSQPDSKEGIRSFLEKREPRYADT
ncbi:MAG TPA: enoyl-CoA hydratase-related protein [Pseudorhodoplanes sp.]|nr:enoyl-CoA hydratase-related protein [Pseudorhodoplanes sp.]